MGTHSPDHPGLTINEHPIGAAVVLAVSGEIDMLTAPQLSTLVEQILTRRPAALIIDLLQVDFLGSAGIAVLTRVHNDAGAMDYAVVADGPATGRPLHLLGIGNVIDIYPSVTAAAAALRQAELNTG